MAEQGDAEAAVAGVEAIALTTSRRVGTFSVAASRQVRAAASGRAGLSGPAGHAGLSSFAGRSGFLGVRRLARGAVVGGG